jgi:uncharacterized membrane protein HdeD (DUF308 family)
MRLDDFLEPLSLGIWEVVIPKEMVTEPLGTEWTASGINVPSPGTIASYRKARFHVHETKTEWRVHLDRYDPKVNPLLHLIDDAPLVLMISDTFMTLIMDTKRTEIKNTEELLKTQGFIWQKQVVSGLILGLAGIFIVKNPVMVFRDLFELILPLAIMCLAVMVLVKTIRARLSERTFSGDLAQGISILCAGIFAFVLPLVLWILVILAVLALWMIASAVLLLRRVVKGRNAVPEGFYSRMAIGIISLVSAILLVISPADILILLIVILGAVTVLLGIAIGINGLRLRTWMKRASTG